MSKLAISKKEINIVIVLVLCFSGWVLPPFGQITALGMKVLGVFLGMIYGWIFVGLGWISLFGMLALAMTGYTSINEAVSQGIGNPTVLQILVGFIMAGVIEVSGLGSIILAKCLSIKGIGKRPWLFATVLLVAAGLISMFAATMAGIFLIWAIINDVAKYNNAPNGDRFIAFLTGATVISAYTLMGALPFKTAALSYLAFWERAETGLTIEMIPFILYATVCLGAALIVMILLAKFVLRIDASRFVINDDQLEKFKNIKVTSDNKKGIVLIVLLFVFLLTPGIFPDGWAFTKLMTQWGLLGSMIVIISLGQILKNSKGEVYAPFSKICQYINWDVIWLMAVTFPLSAAMESTDSGIMTTIVGMVTPLLGHMNPVVFTILVAVFCGLLTQIVHNVILGAMFMPICISLIIGMGGNPIVLWFAMYFALCSAYGTPAASVVAGLIFGHNSVPRKEGFVIGFTYLAAMLIVIVIIGIPLGYMMF